MSSLFVYGTLGPGRPNAHILENIGGRWLEGCVRGRLVDEGWGADFGFPGIVLESGGDEVKGYLFISDALSAHWAMLDEFEGEGYERVPVEVITADGNVIDSNIYGLKRKP